MFVLDFLLMQFAIQLSVSENIPGQKNRSRTCNNDIVLSLIGCPMSLCNPFKLTPQIRKVTQAVSSSDYLLLPLCKAFLSPT